jgi:hypothetical protein
MKFDYTCFSLNAVIPSIIRSEDPQRADLAESQFGWQEAGKYSRFFQFHMCLRAHIQQGKIQ